MERKRAGEEALPYGPDPKNLDIFRVLGLTNPGRIGGSLLLGLHVLRAGRAHVSIGRCRLSAQGLQYT